MSDPNAVIEEPKEEPQAAPEATDAQEPSLDELLKDYEVAEEPKPEPVTDPDINTLAEKIKELEEAEQRREVDGEISALAGQIRGDLSPEVFDDKFMRVYVEAEAQRDPRLQAAFLRRDQHPTAWNSVVKSLAKSFQGKFSSMPDRQATDDRNAVESAVRSASTKAPERDEEISHSAARKMSDTELREYLAKHSK